MAELELIHHTDHGLMRFANLQPSINHAGYCDGNALFVQTCERLTELSAVLRSRYEKKSTNFESYAFGST